MLEKLKSAKVQNIQLEAEVNEKKVQISVNGASASASAWVNFEAEHGSSINVSYNTLTKTSSSTLNNIKSVTEAAVLVNAIIEKLIEVTTELNSYETEY